MGASMHKEVGSPGSEPVFYQDTTPPRDPCTQKQLACDPRSPSDDITRTPILVEKTPLSFSHLDPRSPTEGVERTPMSFLISRGLSAQEMDEVDVTTPMKSASSDVDNIDTEDFSPLLTNELIPSSQTVPVEPTPVPTRPVPLPKQLFPTDDAAKSVPLTRPTLGLVARPINSPRTIVQTKQRRQVSKALGAGGRLEYSSIIDKENIAH